MQKHYNSKVVNLIKLVYIPMTINIVVIIGIVTFSIYFNTKILQKQYKEEGILLATQIADQLARNINSQNYAESILENKIRIAASTILEIKRNNTTTISDEWLIKMLDVLDVSEIHYLDKDGKIIFSTIQGYLGWTPDKGHPLYNFVRSNNLELMEETRPDDKYKKLIKYGAIKGNDGSFVQVGIEAKIVEFTKAQFNYQTIIDDISKNEKVINSQYLDLGLNVIAHSGDFDIQNTEKFNFDINYFNSKDDVFVEKVYFEETSSNGYSYFVPIYYDSKLYGILNITYNLESLNEINYSSIMFYTLLILVVLSNLIWFQHTNIIVPVYELEKSINKIDVTKYTNYKIPEQTNGTFSGLVGVINKILDNTYEFIYKLSEALEEIELSNEELSVAYNQIQASEELLKMQYNEINAQKKHIEYIAYHDKLTGLLNRQGFIKDVKKKLDKDESGAIILIGIDNFKSINNTLGHDFGDSVLIRISEILNGLSLNNNSVAKFSGDEFIIYYSGFRDFKEIDNLLTYLNKKLKEILILENKKVYITTSIGISIYPTDSKKIEKLIVNADSAMYRVKEKGKNGYLYFNEDMVKFLQERAIIESAIRDSVDKNLFKVVYQPQVSLYTGKITGLEALLRMKNYKYTPNVFIPIAEEVGSIIPIGRWVIKTVIEQISEWLKEGVEVKPIAINFSPKQLMDKTLHQYLNNVLDQYDIPAKYLEIEITENILIDNIEEALSFLNRIKNLGIKMALDDFGAGFSSIKYLSTLPIDKVKLDKSMINKFTSENKDEVIKSIVQLSHCFELSFLAEGVEDKLTMLKLKSCGCDTVQGYYFSKPLEVDEIKKIMNVTFEL